MLFKYYLPGKRNTSTKKQSERIVNSINNFANILFEEKIYTWKVSKEKIF